MSVTLSPWPESSARLLAGVATRPVPNGGSKGPGRSDGPKRLKISVLGSAPNPQLTDSTALRNTLEKGIRTVLNNNQEQSLDLSLTQIFAACHLYVSGGSGMELAAMVQHQLSQTCTKLAREIVADKDRGVHSSVWLFDLTSRWSNFYDHQVATLSSMLAYLDRGYLLPNSQPSIRQQALDLAKSTIFKLPAVVKRILEAVEEWAGIEREIAALRAVGQADSSRPEEIRPPVIKLVHTLTLLGFYEEFFEEPYIRNARSFFKERSDKYCNELKKSPQEFLQHWAKLAEAEEERAYAVLQHGSWEAAERAAEDAFVGERVKWLAEDGLRQLFAQRSDNGDIAIDTLRNLYDILLRTEGRDLLRAEWSAYLTRQVITIVEGDAAVMIDGLLELHGFAGRVVRDAFRELNIAGSRRDVFSHGLDDAFERGFQARGKEVAVQIAKYIDTKLRSSTKTLSEEARDALLDSVLLLFRYTADKDVFRTFYTRALARRLLRGNTADNDAEKRVIQKLMREYDPDFEKGLEMFKDLELSQELLDGFLEKMRFRGLDGDASKMTAMVLQTTAWPIHGVVTIQLPEKMLKVLSEYERFYKTKHNGRAITWHHEQGFAVVNAWFPKRDGPYNLHVSLFQAVVLELFNEAESLTFREILDQTKLEKEELKRALNSLSAKQHRILVKRPTKDVDDDTVFSINDAFEHTRVKVTVNQIIPPAAEAADDKRAHAEVDGFRINAIDSAIVRYMKQHKTCTHHELELAVMDSTLKFKPTTKFIKERIGWLMANDYMTRDEEDQKVYHYVA